SERADPSRLRPRRDARPHLSTLRGAGDGPRHACATRTGASRRDRRAEGAVVMETRAVDPSVSRTPIPLDADDLATACVLCSHNCGLRVDVRGGEIGAVRADERSPTTGGYVSNKAFSIASYVKHAHRTEHPLRRRPDGTFERISWDPAITEIAAKLRDIRDRHSPRAI